MLVVAMGGFMPRLDDWQKIRDWESLRVSMIYKGDLGVRFNSYLTSPLTLFFAFVFLSLCMSTYAHHDNFVSHDSFIPITANKKHI